MGYPSFTADIPTAAVSFDKEGNLCRFIFNPKFWNECNVFERCFVIIHESLHVILNHGNRLKNVNRQAANIAMDIAIHEVMKFKLGFKLEDVSFYSDLCTVENVFKDVDVDRKGSAEYYYEQLIEHCSDTSQYSTIDSHDFLFQDFQKIVDDVVESLPKSEADKINKCIEAGKERGEVSYKFNFKEKVKPKRKWETVIKKWSQKFKNQFQSCEQWCYPNRRLSTLPKKVKIPTDIDNENVKKDRIRVSFYQDSSGSCWDLKDRFFKAALSLPKDKFDVQLFCFDTQVYEVDAKKNEIYGGGGTMFDIIENHAKSSDKYPDAVFVITDGYGNSVTPAIPKRWYWFLSTKYDNYIPKECNVHQLEDFE